jgi:hypothetical protein
MKAPFDGSRPLPSFLAEREGFEPSRGLSPLLAFQASAFNRSTTSPARVLAVLAGVVLVSLGAAPPEPARHAIPGHFNVPHARFAAPLATLSGNVVTNSGFESGAIDGGWYQCGDVNAYVTSEHPFSGSFAEYSGTENGIGEPRGNSGVCQRVTVPAGGLLTARLYQLSNEGGATFAYQEADLLDDRGNVVVNLFKTVNYKTAWVLGKWNLGAYSGRTFWLYFGVHGDGYAKLSTQQFVDDVVLTSASSATSK